MKFRQALNKLCIGLLVSSVILAILNIAGNSIQSKPRREKVLSFPTVAGFIGTFEFYLPTHLVAGPYLWVSEPNTDLTDASGFRKSLYTQPESGRTVLFLGGSTSQGGYRNFPDMAANILTFADQPTRFVNAACSSYSTFQCAEMLDRIADQVKPDVVFVYEGWNDMGVTDGYADKSKFAGVAKSVWIPKGLARLIGAVLPEPPMRPRATPEETAQNLARMRKTCERIGARMIVAVRPCAERPASQGWGGAAEAYWRAKTGESEPLAQYRAVWKAYADVQRSAGESFDMAAALKPHELKASRDGILFYSPDACHLSSYGNRKLAEEVALYLAEDKTLVQTVIDSSAYRQSVADELWQDFEPVASANYWPRNTNEVAIAAECREVFDRCKWGGSETNFEKKIEGLRWLMLRLPSDIGIAIQIQRVGMYMNRSKEARLALADFRPANDGQRAWLAGAMQ